MQTNLIYIRKQAIPKLLGLLGKALSEEGDNVCLKECKYTGGYTMIKLGEELVDEYGDEETYSNSEFSVGFEFNKPDKDWTIDGGPGIKNEKQFYEGTTPGTGLSLPNPSVYDGLVIK